MATYKIKGARLLRKYKAQFPTLSYMALSEAERISSSLGDVPWTAVQSRSATFPAHSGASEESDAENVAMRDNFDAALFCAEHNGQRHRAYANAACYRFVLPEEAEGKSLSSIKMHVYCDPYNAAGARVSVYTANDAEPPMGCPVCRTGSFDDVSASSQSNNAAEGEIATEWYSSNTHVEGVAPRRADAGRWFENDGYAIIEPEGGLILGKYLFVFVMMENYATARAGFLEGAAFVDPVFELTTAEEIAELDANGLNDLSSQKDFGNKFLVNGDEIAPKMVSGSAEIKTLALQYDGRAIPSRDNQSHKNILTLPGLNGEKLEVELDGEITSVNHILPQASVPSGAPPETIQFVIVTGKFSKRTFKSLPGYLVYDVVTGKFIENLDIKLMSPALTDLNSHSKIIGGACVPGEIISGNDNKQFAVDFYVFFEKGSIVYTDDIVAPFSRIVFNYPSREVEGAVGKSFLYSSQIDCHFFVQPKMFKMLYSTVPYYGFNTCMFLSKSGNVLKSVPVSLSAASLIATTISLPADGIHYEGDISSVKSMSFVADTGVAAIIVSGNLQKVGDVECKNCAILMGNGENWAVTKPNFDSQITPDTYENFTVSGVIPIAYLKDNRSSTDIYSNFQYVSVTNVFIVTGAFNWLNYDLSLSKNVAVTAAKPSVDPFPSKDTNEYAIISSGDYPLDYGLVGGAQYVNGLVAGGSGKRKTKVFDVVEPEEVSVDLSIPQSYLGVRGLYGGLYKGTLSNRGAKNERCGASFVVKSDAIELYVNEEGKAQAVNVPVWKITTSSLVVPFPLPQDFKARRIELKWDKKTATGGRFNVWLKRGEYISEVPQIADPSIYVGDKNAVGDWELLGLISSDGTYAVFDIEPLTGFFATLYFTAYISLDELDLSGGTVNSQGVCTEIDIDPNTGAVSGADETWKPSITLLG
jgi:hypothetical protein